MKNVYLSSSEAKRVILWIVLYFFRLRRLTLRKSTPLESSLEFPDSQNYENTNEHLLIWACKIHESVTYQALFSLLFNIVKNEERLELNFLDSLKLNKKIRKNLSLWVINSGRMSSLTKELSKLFDTHVSVYTSISSITLIFYSFTCPLYTGNLIMSPTWQISLVFLSTSQNMPWFISVSFSLFKDQ